MAYRFLPTVKNGRYCLENNKQPKDKPFYFLEPWQEQGSGSYISLTDDIHQWFLENNVSYRVIYTSIHYIGYRIEIENKND